MTQVYLPVHVPKRNENISTLRLHKCVWQFIGLTAKEVIANWMEQHIDLQNKFFWSVTTR